MLVSRNPLTGETLKEYPPLPVEQIGEVFTRARVAQAQWALIPVKRRARAVLQVREAVLNHMDDLLNLLIQENGKPRFEALATEVGPAVHTITHYAKRAPELFKNHSLDSGLFKHRSAYLNYWPHGVVAVISPWNFPFYLPLSDIVAALLAGNAVVFKPSELSCGVALKIQELFEEAALPRNLVQTVLGGADLGQAILAQHPDKISFTGGVETGRAIAAEAAKTFTPVTLELGGKNAMIVMADADVEFASSAALWGGFVNSGQVCGAISRIFVHEKVSEVFQAKLKMKAETLRTGDPNSSETDLGAVTSQKQKAIYNSLLEDARSKGATVLTGGSWDTTGNRLAPTLVYAPEPKDIALFRDEAFGPIIAIAPFRSTAEAIEKVNASSYGLTASIVTKNIPLAEQIAKQLEVGTVMINEVIFTAGAPEVPWGGVKNSGLGVRHSDAGLLEYSRVRHINKPRSRMLSNKSLVWFPYTPFQYEFLRNFLGLYRIHWTDKIKAFPHFLLNLVKFFKFEKRI